MVSLEKEKECYQRAEFNKPYACIDVQNISASSYIADFDAEGKDIFWLDYDSPREMGESFANFVSILRLLNTESIVKITLNASPSTLSENNVRGTNEEEIRAKRMVEFKTRIPEDYLPAQISEENFKSSTYPLLLLNCLDIAAKKALGNSPLSDKKVEPLFSTIYADGQQMLTLTLIILRKTQSIDTIRDLLSKKLFTKPWNDPIIIDAPELTLKEILEINQHIPNEEAKKYILDTFPYITPEFRAENYLQFYKYYPNFHHFNL